MYNGCCAFCSSAPSADLIISVANIVPGSRDLDYTIFSSGYESPLDVKSPRNYLPLCGTREVYGTCHVEFDKFRITLLYDPLVSKYKIFCLDLLKSTKNILHEKVIEVGLEFPPYRRLLAWRARKCILEHGSKMEDKRIALFEFAKFSDRSKSIASEDVELEEETIDISIVEDSVEVLSEEFDHI